MPELSCGGSGVTGEKSVVDCDWCVKFKRVRDKTSHGLDYQKACGVC